jgi:hypothetical protein
MGEKNPWMRPSADTKPATKADKVMSKRHKENRKRIKKMDDGPGKKAASRYYNLTHAAEHLKAPGTGGRALASQIDALIQKTGRTMGDLKKR